jgi:hypothetical protein
MTVTLSRITAGGGRRGRRSKGRGVAVVAAVSCAVLLAGSGVASAVPGARAGATAGAARIRWGKAELVPGLAALNKGDQNSAYSPPSASVNAVSCWGAGGCVVGGFYTDGHEHLQAFVARERNGRWGKAVEVPGTAALNQGGHAQVGRVSCARTSVCVAVGTYTNKAGNGQWFTVTERDGQWGKAAEVPDPALNQASIGTVWCAPGGLCAAGGTFTDPAGTTDAWVRTEVRGRWRPALEVPGLAALNTNGNGALTGSGLDSVACASAGNCAAGGHYDFLPANYFEGEAFVVTETNGTWGSAEEVPGIESINEGQAGTTFMSCPSAGNCAAAGYFGPLNLNVCDETDCNGAFAVSERHGTWGQVQRIGGAGFVEALTCPATGDCVAAGSSIYQAHGEVNVTGIVLSETNDNWSPPLLLPSTGSVNSAVNSVSCALPGYCAAGGSGVNSGIEAAFVISEWHGTWGKAIRPAGIAAGHSASVTAVACPPKVTLCIAGGNETPANSTRAQAFIVSQTG